MSCGQYERSIALRIGGDLPRGDEMRLEMHLADCPRCRQFAAELRESQDALLRWRSESPGDNLLERVRRSVLTQIAQGNERARFWQRMPLPFFSPSMRIAFGVTAACMLLVVLWIASPRRIPEQEMAIGKNEPEAAAGVPKPVAVEEKPGAHEPGKPASASESVKRPPSIAAVRSPAGPPAPLMPRLQATEYEAVAPPPPLRIELQTADPNVRIIWFVPQKPKEKAATGPVGGQEPGLRSPALPPERHESIFVGRNHGHMEATNEGS